MYAELHCLSNFSFQRGASHPAELVAQARELGYQALAVTDECSLAGIVRAWKKAKETDFPLIVGSEFLLSAAEPDEDEKRRASKGEPAAPPTPPPWPVQPDHPQLFAAFKCVLLAPTKLAYRQLCQLITHSRRRSVKSRYRTTLADLERDCGELLALWCPVWPAQGWDEALLHAQASALHQRFGNRLWIAWERHLHPEDRERYAVLDALGRHLRRPLVAAGDAHTHARGRQPLQDVLACVRAGCTLGDPSAPVFRNAEHTLRPVETLQKLYPAALLKETLAIVERCRFHLKDDTKYVYPHEVVPEDKTAIEHLRDLVEKGVDWRWPQGCPPKVRDEIEKELALIEHLRYEHFFLTVEDIVRFARKEKILCQGRGSAANSVVCYALGITEVDPGRMRLLFERFLSKERDEPPDIDVDFEHERREEVIQYVFDKYGRHRTALAATVICYRRRSATRDVGKVLGLSPEQVDVLAKNIAYWEDHQRLEAVLQQQGFVLGSALVQNLLHLVNVLRGFPRHLSQHVGGFVISDEPLASLVPVENAAMKDRTVIQWDKDDLEAMDMLKVDVLALGMLTALRRSFDLLKTLPPAPGRLTATDQINEGDEATYAMIGRGETTGVFQIESRAQMSFLPRMKPKNYFDLVIEVAIVRPGPIQGGMVHPYLRRRQGREKPEYIKPELEAVLSCTLGVPLFQEQVMDICMVAGGFTAGRADEVRRSMAAWKEGGDLTYFKKELLEGMTANGYTAEFAERIYQQILGFGSYGFPQSHAASFALLTYTSCWLKCHQPAAFCAGLLNSQPMGFYAPAQLVNDARRNGVRFRPADVQCSDWDCTLELDGHGEPEVRLGLRMVQGLDKEEGRRLARLRAEQGPFASVEAMAQRAGLARRTLDRLADAGALQGLAGHRHQARWSAAGAPRLPRLLARSEVAEADVTLPAPREGAEVLADYRALGLTLARHPLALLRSKLHRQQVVPADRLRLLKSGTVVTVAGLVTHRQRPGTAKSVMFVTLEDETGTINLVIWLKVQESCRDAVMGSRLMRVHGRVQNEEGVVSVLALQVENATMLLGELPTGSRDFH